jgi:uncharacterized protein YciI|tara:strand:- start:66 stop:542 length:477 start_codon:yes stop_codon:yes gene_type:complete
VQRPVSIGLLLALLFIVGLPIAADPNPPVYLVAFHSPGPNWNYSRSAADQPGMAEHHRYVNALREAGKVILGGDYLDHAGGMMIYQMKTIQEARLAANNDPAVKAGLLKVEVKTWRANLSSVRIVAKRRSSAALDRKQPFKIKSANQGAPINLKDEPD